MDPEPMDDDAWCKTLAHLERIRQEEGLSMSRSVNYGFWGEKK